MENPIKKIFDDLSDESIQILLNEIDECEKNGFFPENAQIRNLLKECSEITKMDVASNLLLIQINTFRQGALRWVKLKGETKNGKTEIKDVIEKKDENRNEFLEIDGLYWESETHEWFHDKVSTRYARTDKGLNKDALPTIAAFVVRNKQTGEYGRVVVDGDTNKIIHETKSLEDLAAFIDKLKSQKRFK